MRVKNISGGPINFPLVGRDVDPDEVIEVPDDTNLPADYFQPVDDKPAKTKKEG
jgi:hypothetical protein